MRETNSSRLSKHNIGPDLDPNRLISLMVLITLVNLYVDLVVFTRMAGTS